MLIFIQKLFQRNHQRRVRIAIIQRNSRRGQYALCVIRFWTGWMKSYFCGKGLPRFGSFQEQWLTTCTIFWNQFWNKIPITSCIYIGTNDGSRITTYEQLDKIIAWKSFVTGNNKSCNVIISTLITRVVRRSGKWSYNEFFERTKYTYCK